MKAIKYQTAKVQLKKNYDANEPTLEARIIDGLGRVLQVIEITTPHPVWRGARLGKHGFRVLEVS